MTDPTTIRRAIAHGVAFLESAQLPTGEIPIEIADTAALDGPRVRALAVFPAAVTARALGITPAAARMHARTLDFLEREMLPNGLWRHPSSERPDRYHTPPDVDDTSLACSALRAAGRPVPDNRDVVLANRDANGLFRTWIVRWWPHPLRTWLYFHVRRIAEIDDVDAVVIANVIHYLGASDATRPSIDHLLDVLRTHREMRSTIWYGSPFAVWYFFSHALRDIAAEAAEMVVPRVQAAQPTNAMERALAASTLQLWDQRPDIEPLLAEQLPSGAWPRAGFYHMGQRRDETRPKTPWWGSEALTTVFAVEALTRALIASGEPP